jgi:peptidoglycan-associated lipoprotein
MVRARFLAVLVISLIFAFTFGCSKKKTVKPVAEKPAVEEVTEEIPVAEEEPVVQETKPAPTCQDVFFDFDKYNLKDEAKATLEMNARELKNGMMVPIIIEGHCDERGTEDYNMALGEKRAKATMDYLVSLGVPGSRFTIISYGESRPFDPGHTEAAWAKNRRAHFVVKK